MSQERAQQQDDTSMQGARRAHDPSVDINWKGHSYIPRYHGLLNGTPSTELHVAGEDTAKFFPYWCAWPDIQNPVHIVRTNRDVVPEVEAARNAAILREIDARYGVIEDDVAAAIRTVDGRYGLLDASRLPQQHRGDAWHMPFIPLMPSDKNVPTHLGRPWWFTEHDDQSGDLGWLRWDDCLLRAVGSGLFRLQIQLRQRMWAAEDMTNASWATYMSNRAGWLKSHPGATPTPGHMRMLDLLREFSVITDLLRHQALKKWEAIRAFGDWQRILNELRGWLTYQTYVRGAEYGPDYGVETGQASRLAVFTRQKILPQPFRGVITFDTKAAQVYAMNDVPVWLLFPYDRSSFLALQSQTRSKAVHRATPSQYGGRLDYLHPVTVELDDKDNKKKLEYLASVMSTRAYTTEDWNNIGDCEGTAEAEAMALSLQVVSTGSAAETGLSRIAASIPPCGQIPGQGGRQNASSRGTDGSSAESSRGARHREPPPPHPRAKTSSSGGGSSVAGATAPRGNGPSPAKGSAGRKGGKTGGKRKKKNANDTGNQDSKAREGGKNGKTCGKRKRDADDTGDQDSKGRERKKMRGVIIDAGVTLKLDEAKISHHPAERVRERWEPEKPAKVPSWFPEKWAPACVNNKVDTGRKRQLQLLVASTLPIPRNAVAQSHLHKVPLASYFANAWNDSMEEGFDQKRKKRRDLTGTEVYKSTKQQGYNVSMGLENWFKLRDIYLRRLALSSAEDVPGLTAKEWRGVVKGIVPVKDSERIANMLGLTNIFNEDGAAQNGVVEGSARAAPLPLSHMAKIVDGALFYDYDDYRSSDDDDDDDDGPRLPPPKKAATWRELEDAVLRGIFDDPAPGEPAVRPEAARAQVESRDWYFQKGTKNKKGVKDFSYYHYEVDDNTGLPSMVWVGSNQAKGYRESREWCEWWDYDAAHVKPRVLFLPAATMYLTGEHVLKTLRFANHDGKHGQRCSRRIWPADHDGVWGRAGIRPPKDKKQAILMAQSLPVAPSPAAAAAAAAPPRLHLPPPPPAAQSLPAAPTMPATTPVKTVGRYLRMITGARFEAHELPPRPEEPSSAEDEPAKEPCMWPGVPMRQYGIWELTELEFRYELFSLDLTIRQSHPTVPAFASMAPYERCMECRSVWGGSDFTPGLDTRTDNALCSPDRRTRLEHLYRFYRFMRVWPRVESTLAPWDAFRDGGDSLNGVDCDSRAFDDLEERVWFCYSQTFFDYRRRYPPVPHVRPAFPFDVDVDMIL
ncbi:hypothetical protein AURDEDRAFT_165717 [Auricularia subglabra TFB-10046 SS5]|nr:hypothetical protein AURDEDRAFT_165717 [Auricularia subglabra TFB-10046 SS5]